MELTSLMHLPSFFWNRTLGHSVQIFPSCNRFVIDDRFCVRRSRFSEERGRSSVASSVEANVQLTLALSLSHRRRLAETMFLSGKKAAGREKPRRLTASEAKMMMKILILRMLWDIRSHSFKIAVISSLDDFFVASFRFRIGVGEDTSRERKGGYLRGILLQCRSSRSSSKYLGGGGEAATWCVSPRTWGSFPPSLPPW